MAPPRKQAANREHKHRPVALGDSCLLEGRSTKRGIHDSTVRWPSKSFPNTLPRVPSARLASRGRRRRSRNSTIRTFARCMTWATKAVSITWSWSTSRARRWRNRLKRGALPLETALDYGMQIADGLDAAHRAGIVHRDLKPGNVMRTPSGIKVLDFGLARLMVEEVDAESSDAPTRQKNLTGEHAIVGTVQYMAPEQLEGKTADARTDIFALGGPALRDADGHESVRGRKPSQLDGCDLGARARFACDGRAKDAAAVGTGGEKVPGKTRGTALALGARFTGRAFLGGSERHTDGDAARRSETPQSARCRVDSRSRWVLCSGPSCGGGLKRQVRRRHR